MARCLIGLGFNLGDRRAILDFAIEHFETLPNVSVQSVSEWLSTEPIGGPSGQGGFLNGAAILKTVLPPHELLGQLRQVETTLGRERRIRWDARTLDVDILLYDDLIVQSETLVIPHPRMTCRRFVLEPTAEIAPDWVHPEIQWTIGRLFEHLQAAPPNFVLCGSNFTPDLVSRIVDRTRGILQYTPDGECSGDCSAADNATTLESSDDQSNSNQNRLWWVDSLKVLNEVATKDSVKLFIIPICGSAEQRDLALEMRELVIQQKAAPVVTISTDDQVVIENEAVAAIEAMK
ncbi:MAG: 2-amino-4-hydroxy-6-hydroxymethyldihydropteridine diphosphokinase [Planctomycetales bacterium]|nr:2-amino-4-hydroxy-6-hydroxymethyldihydropteridine diphosphokinase [Planctomycetales bacterium]